LAVESGSGIMFGKTLTQRELSMVITLGPELEAALNELARRKGVAPEVLALNALRERFLAAAALQPRDDWERGLLEAARDCGVSLPDSALSSEGLYD
jgi:predicted transcriptional regulator